MTTVLDHETHAAPEVRQTKMLIGGRWCDSASGKMFPTINPATEEKIADVSDEIRLRSDTRATSPRAGKLPGGK